MEIGRAGEDPDAGRKPGVGTRDHLRAERQVSHSREPAVRGVPGFLDLEAEIESQRYDARGLPVAAAEILRDGEGNERDSRLRFARNRASGAWYGGLAAIYGRDRCKGRRFEPRELQHAGHQPLRDRARAQSAGLALTPDFASKLRLPNAL